MQLGAYVLEKMGLTRYPSGKMVIGVYYRIEIFRIDGFFLKSSVVRPKFFRIDRTDVQIAVGSSINAISQCLSRNDITKNESEWINENKTSGPYCMLLVGPSEKIEKTFEYIQETSTEIIVYDPFQQMQHVLDISKLKIIPSILSALSISFNDGTQDVKFYPLQRIFYGETSDGKTIKPFSVTGSATLSTSREMEDPAILEALGRAANLASRIDSKVADFYSLALTESDFLKKFLYFFMSIEVEIHRVYKTIDHRVELDKIVIYPSALGESTRILFGEHRNSWNNLRERFIWCSVCVWKNISDVDVNLFQQLKIVRDEIAHGVRSVPQPSSVRDVEVLARKIYRHSL